MTSHLPRQIIAIALLIASATLLIGCGSKGDLYLPTEDAAQR